MVGQAHRVLDSSRPRGVETALLSQYLKFTLTLKQFETSLSNGVQHSRALQVYCTEYQRKPEQ